LCCVFPVQPSLSFSSFSTAYAKFKRKGNLAAVGKKKKEKNKKEKVNKQKTEI